MEASASNRAEVTALAMLFLALLAGAVLGWVAATWRWKGRA